MAGLLGEEALASPVPGSVGRRLLRRRPRWIVVLSVVVAAALLLPLVFLVMQARLVGGAEIKRILFRRLTLDLLRNTVELAVLVTLATAVIGVSAAWCIERTTLPLRRFWAVLIVLPAAVPDFIVGYAWHSIVPSLTGLRGATIVMSLALYPLVYLPVAAALRRVDPVARGDGALARLRAVDDVSPRDAAADPSGAAGRLPRRDARASRRVRRVRDPALPDVHDRGLHRVPGRPVRGGVAGPGAGGARHRRALPAKGSSPDAGGSAAAVRPPPARQDGAASASR